MTLQIDEAKFNDLVTFAELEIKSGDLEPWAEIIKQLKVQCSWSEETALWMVRLYNAFDSMSSAWGAYKFWELPGPWDMATPFEKRSIQFPHMMERRNLHGGRGQKCFQSYCDLIKPYNYSQERWLEDGLKYRLPENSEQKGDNFLSMFEHLQKVWGVGRLASFEWTEFLQKVNGFPIDAPHACLWESSGPKKSLELLYGVEEPSEQQLDDFAQDCRARLVERGVYLRWIDFETVICDFKVMRHGRYYPGRHLAALRGEIEEVKDEGEREVLLTAFMTIIPEPWCYIPPFIDKALMPVYKDTGKIVLPEGM
jgi:hypothetical protein